MPAVDPGLRLAEASGDFKFAAAVAQFGLLLSDSPIKGSARYDLVRTLAEQGLGEDRLGERAEFISLVARAELIVSN